MVGKMRRDDADDTGEIDVSALRERFQEPTSSPADEDSPLTDAEIESVLLQMVDDGELCWGWVEEIQEFGFWQPDSTPTGVTKESKTQPVRQGKRVRQVLVALVVAVAVPLSAGILDSVATHGAPGKNEQVSVPSEVTTVSFKKRRAAPNPEDPAPLPQGSESQEYRADLAASVATSARK